MKFFDCKHRVQQSLTNLSLVDELLTIWSLSNRVTLDTNHQIEAVLAVNAVATGPVITIYENGAIEEIKNINNLTSPDIFTQFVVHPIKFHEFICQHWDATCLSLFVYQLQALTPDLACCAANVVKATNGKRNDRTVGKLEEIAEILDLKGFRIIGYAFDGNSCFSRLHSELEQHWNIETFEEATPNMIFNTRARRLIVTDPLHILKRIRYHFLSGPFRFGVGHDQTEFCIDDVRDK
jgi:hypothetical protein